MYIWTYIGILIAVKYTIYVCRDLTEKGVKKLQNSVDISYSTIHSLVSKPLQMASINMFYFLNTIKGLSRINHYFTVCTGYNYLHNIIINFSFLIKHLIVSESAEKAIRTCGAFLMKILEFQQVIDQSVNDMKLFFTWLCVVIVRLHQQDVPDEMIQLSMEDTIYLAEYLNSFEDSVVDNGKLPIEYLEYFVKILYSCRRWVDYKKKIQFGKSGSVSGR